MIAPPLKRTLSTAAALVLLLAAVVLVRAATYRSTHSPPAPVAPLPLDEAKVAGHLARAITIQTVSSEEKGPAPAEVFAQLHAALAEMFPRAHQALRREVVAEKSLLYTFEGTDPALKPILLLGHLDVVGIEAGTEGDWQQPPFAGTVVDGQVWGRGARDFKLGVVASLQAIEILLEQGFRPRRTVHLAFGHDEELGGHRGAGELAKLLQSRGLRMELVLDEGMTLTTGMAPGIDRPVALIGVAEKGCVNVELVAKAEGGHSSMPPSQTAIGILSRAITRLEERQMPRDLDGPISPLLDALGREMGFGNRIIFANRWLFGPLVERRLSARPASDALLHTTTAVTIFDAGVKRSALPKQARAIANFRILPGDSVASVVDHVREVVDDPRIALTPLEESRVEPSPVSDITTPGYRLVEQSIREVFPSAVVAPSLFMGRTDSRYYMGLSDAVYRFSPQRVAPGEASQFHGTNERIPLSNLAESVRFYAQLIRNASAP
jgi:carboxypeptidase PM20D1